MSDDFDHIDDPFAEVARLSDFLRAWHEAISTSRVLDVRKNLKPQTKLIVRTTKATVELTILDGPTGRVMLKDGETFLVPTEGTLLGTMVSEPSPFAADNEVYSERSLLDGQVKRGHVLVYEANGIKRYRDSIRGVRVIVPSGASYDLWRD